MGLLAETKSRRKLGHDPNNTKWSRDTNTFGQKILRAQGWQPGEFLGAQDAPHSELHTSANASYIRVTLKDDMKGLGFNKRKEDEITGLNEFSDLLSRLNGKSDAAVEQEKQARMEVKMNAYVQSRYGPMRFVKGGLLVGDDMKELESTPTKDGSTPATKDPAAAETKKDKKSKKRKAASLDGDDDSSSKNSEEKSKKRRREDEKSKKSSAEASDEDSTEGDRLKSEKKKKKQKRSKSKKDKSRGAGEEQAAVEEEADPTEQLAQRESRSKKDGADSAEDSDSDSDSKAKKAKKERKEEKRAKKERKQEKKEEKRKKKEAKALRDSASGISSAEPSSTDATPAGSGASTPRNPHRVRSRFLAAKREAMTNDKAMAKIWMVKA